MTSTRRGRADAQGRLFEPTSWQGLTSACAEIARDLGLDVETEVYVGRRIWGARRRIDIVVTDRAQRRSLGIEAKYQKSAGSAEEKIPSTIEDIRAWPIPANSEPSFAIFTRLSRPLSRVSDFVAASRKDTMRSGRLSVPAETTAWAIEATNACWRFIRPMSEPPLTAYRSRT